MHNFLLQIHEISQTCPDQSDYDNFCTRAVAFLKNTKSGHSTYFWSLKKALNLLYSEQTRKIVYTLLATLNIDIHLHESIDSCNPDCHFLDVNTLAQDIVSKSLLSSIISLLIRHNIKNYNEIITERVLNNDFIPSETIIRYMFENEAVLIEYMKEDDETYLQNQLFIMLKRQIMPIFLNINLEWFNIDFYFKFLGSSSKLLAFRAFESLSSLCIRWDEFNRPNIVHFLPTTRLSVESVIRFVSFFFNFVYERDEIIELCRNKKVAEINRILRQYVGQNITENEFSSLCLIYARQPMPSEPEFCLTDEFTYLFDGSTKEMCDCLEI